MIAQSEQRLGIAALEHGICLFFLCRLAVLLELQYVGFAGSFRFTGTCSLVGGAFSDEPPKQNAYPALPPNLIDFGDLNNAGFIEDCRDCFWAAERYTI